MLVYVYFGWKADIERLAANQADQRIFGALGKLVEAGLMFDRPARAAPDIPI